MTPPEALNLFSGVRFVLPLNTLHRLGRLEEWYSYRAKIMKEFVIDWANENDVAFEDDTRV